MTNAVPILRLLSLCVLLLFVVVSSVQALDPNKRITQYQHRSWRVDDGTPPSAPNWIAQTTDGYLMIGLGGLGSGGVLQFDGVRFAPWSSPVVSLNDMHMGLPAKAGGFWISYSHGVAHIQGKRVLAHFDLQVPVYGVMVEDVDGSLWVAGAVPEGKGKPLCHITDQAHCFGEADGVHFIRPSAIALDGKGGVWIGTDTALVHWRPGHSETYECSALRANKGQTGITSILPDSDGSLWVGVASQGLGLQKFVGGVFRPVVIGGFDGRKIVVYAPLFMDREQNLWVGTDANGLYRIHGEAVDHFGKNEGLSGNAVYQIFEDRERIIWVATSGGLDSFADQSVTTFSLSTEFSVSVVASRDGTVWVGNNNSLDSIRNGVVSSIRPSDGLPGQQVTSLLEDHAGQLWVGVDDGLFLYENHHFRRLREPNHHPLGMVVGITEDTDGNVWAECASQPRKLVRIRNFRVQEEFSSSQVPAGHALAADPRTGIWVSTLAGDLVQIQNGNLRTFPLNLNGEIPIQVEAEMDGSVLMAAPNEGLVALYKGRVQRLTKANGFPCDGLFAFIRDDQKNWWLETPCGYISLADSEMQRWLAHPDAAVQYQILDRFDGARPVVANFDPATKSPDGRLWFAQGSVQTIDPHHLLFNQLPPLVHIEQIIGDRKGYEADIHAGARVTLPPLIRDLEIDYTALSLLVPQKILFRYKLDGLDHEWHDVGNRRQAFYTNLGPGSYRFHVIACNNDGVWNNEGAGLDFNIAPAWFQTIWFRAFCVCVFLFLLWMLYQLRLRQLQRQFNRILEARISERSRIARELHDTLLQSFQGVVFLFQGATSLLLARPDEARQKLEGALDQAEQAIVEGRDAVHDMRSSEAASELSAAINAFAEELTASKLGEGSPAIRVRVGGTPRSLNPILYGEIYRIAGEALRNAFQHAQAHEIEAEIIYGERQLVMRVRDDGKGVDADILDHGRAGHFGLPGMRERAKLIGASLEVRSTAGSGMEIELAIASSIAYTKSRPARRWRVGRFRRS